MEFLPLYSVERKAEESTKPVGSRQKQSVSQESPLSNNLQKSVDDSNLSTRQKVRSLITSEKFKQQIKEAAEAGTVPESLKSLSNFQDHLVSEGMEEFAEYDFSTLNIQNNFQTLFQKYHPGQVPSDLDAEMRRRFVDAVQKFGYQEGKGKFMQTPEVIAWATVRFEMWKLTDFSKPQEGKESISTWMNSIDFNEFRDIEEAPVSMPPSLQEDTFSDAPTLNGPVAETEQAPPEAWEDSTIRTTAPSAAASPTVEPEKIVTSVSPEPSSLPTDEELETTLRERFSSERFERAMSTLKRYGPEEGLRRLREDDPEIAEQIEDSRNEVEQHRDRSDREEDAQ